MNRGKKPDPPPAGRPAWRTAAAALLTLAAVGGLVWGIARLGDEARRGIGPRDRYAVRFADIDCNPPPGRDRESFLAEVRYVSDFPETFQSLDPELTPRLTAAFTAHPWVAAVENVSVDPAGKIAVKLRHRTPFLAVKLTDGSVRAVDASGAVLPREASTGGLPVLTTPVTGADPAVKRAVELVETHHPRQLEKTAQGWRLTLPDGKTLVVDR